MEVERTEESNPILVEIIRAEIERDGPMTFARFMELALYHPAHGYYLSAERRPGRGGDFLTAPEATPLFGLTLARQIAECWERLERPEPFVVREYGAGVGGLAYDVIAGLSTEAPEVAAALQYRLIEPNQHRLAQALAAMKEVGLAHVVMAEDGDDVEPIIGVALANEVADALPVHRLVLRDGQFRERNICWRNIGLAEVEGEPSPAAWTAIERLRAEGVVVPDGAAVDVSPAAAEWFAGVGRGLARGYAIIVDYGYPAQELYRAHRLEGTVRAYFAHTVADDALVRVGRQDLTAHVDFTALQRAGEAVGMRVAGFTTQGAFLASLGLGGRLVEMQRDPETTMPDYLAAQAAVLRLIDPGGLGRFGVLIMAKDAPVEPPLAGFAVTGPAF
ncbi:MAG: class I SAM-dependent methyltransferase [Thermomicrobiales bacterium]